MEQDKELRLIQEAKRHSQVQNPVIRDELEKRLLMGAKSAESPAAYMQENAPRIAEELHQKNVVDHQQKINQHTDNASVAEAELKQLKDTHGPRYKVKFPAKTKELQDRIAEERLKAKDMQDTFTQKQASVASDRVWQAHQERQQRKRERDAEAIEEIRKAKDKRPEHDTDRGLVENIGKFNRKLADIARSRRQGSGTAKNAGTFD